MAVVLLTSLEEVKNALDITGGDNNGWLNTLIRTCSFKIARELGRAESFEVIERTEILDVKAEQRVFALKADPIVSVAEVRFDLEQDFPAGTTFDADNFTVDSLKGLLRFRFDVLGAYQGIAPQSLEVRYTGGIGSTLAAIRATKYGELEDWCLQWIQMVYKRQNLTFEQISASGQGGSVNLGELKMPVDIRRGIRQLRRRPVAA